MAIVAGLPGWTILPLALAAAGALLWLALALDALVRRGRSPSRAEVTELLLLQRSQHDFNHAAWARLDRDASVLMLLAADQRLPAIDADLAIAAARIERYEAVAAALPAWRAALDRWSAVAATVEPAAAIDPTPPDDAALRAARTHLPFGRNLASADLKAALLYIVDAERLAIARGALADSRGRIMRSLPAETDGLLAGSD